MKLSYLWFLLCPLVITIAHGQPNSPTFQLQQLQSQQNGVHLKGNTSAAFFPDGNRLATLSSNQRSYNLITIWEATTSKELLTITAQPVALTEVLVSPQGNRIYSSGGDKTVRAWDSMSGKEVSNFASHLGEVLEMVLSPDGRYLYTTSNDRGTQSIGDNAEIKCWDTTSSKESFAIRFPETTEAQPAGQKFTPFKSSGAVRSLVVSPDGKWLAGLTFNPRRTGQEQGAVKLWSATSGKEMWKFPISDSYYAMNVTFNPDSKQLAYINGPIQILNVLSGKADSTIRFEHDDNDQNKVVYSPDGKVIAVVGNLTVKVLDAASGKLLQSFKSANNVHGVTFSPDSRRLTAACGGFNEIYGSKGDVKLWEVATGKLLVTYGGHRGYVKKVIISPDGKRLVAVNAVSISTHELPR